MVAAFCLAVHNGGDISEALNIARSISTPHDISFHELLQPQNLEVESLRDEVMNLAASVKNILTNMTDEHFVSKAISMTSMYPTAPYSDLVIPQICLFHLVPLLISPFLSLPTFFFVRIRTHTRFTSIKQ